MSSSSPRCCWCGTELPQAAGLGQALLCSSCSGAAPAAPPPPPPAAVAPPPRDRQPVLWLGVAIAAVLLLGGGSVLLALLPRGDAPPPAPAAPVRQVAAADVPKPDPGPPSAPAEAPPPAPRPEVPPAPQAPPRLGDLPAAPPPPKPPDAPPRTAPTEAELRQQLARTGEVPLCGRGAYALATIILAEQKDAPAAAVPARLRAALRAAAEGPPPKWLRPENVPGLVELLAEEDAADRRLLVKLLGRVRGPKATEALARRATFDLDPGARQAAVKELQGRPPEEYRPTFLKALRSPWPPPAEHAAKALLDLKDRGAAPALVLLLKQPDPAAPRQADNGRTVVREVVRTHHVTACALCHPPAVEEEPKDLPASLAGPLPGPIQNNWRPRYTHVLTPRGGGGGHVTGHVGPGLAGGGYGRIHIQIPKISNHVQFPGPPPLIGIPGGGGGVGLGVPAPGGDSDPNLIPRPCPPRRRRASTTRSAAAPCRARRPSGSPTWPPRGRAARSTRRC